VNTGGFKNTFETPENLIYYGMHLGPEIRAEKNYIFDTGISESIFKRWSKGNRTFTEPTD